MTLVPSNRYVNIYSGTFTPAGGSAVTITGIKGVKYDDGISVIRESGDGDLYHTVAVTDLSDPTIEVDTIDGFSLASVLNNQVGTLAVTIGDAVNKVAVGGGGKTITMTNARLTKRTNEHAHRQFSKAMLSFCAISTDGSTSPIAVAAL